MNAKIEAISVYLPEKILSNEEIDVKYPHWKVHDLFQITGVKERRIAAEGEIASDMAVKAAERLFDEHGINNQEIDFIIHCSQTTDFITPSTACLMQDRLKISKKAGATDVGMGCTGYIYGLSLANGLISSGSASKVLLLTSEKISDYIYEGDKSNRVLFGDAATASLISQSDKSDQGIDQFVFGTDGSGAKNIIIKHGGARYPKTASSAETHMDEYGNIRNDDSFFMNGQAVYSFSIKTAPPLIEEILKKSDWRKEEVDFYVLHQASKLILDSIRRKIDVPAEKYVYYLESVGNTVASTIPLALEYTLKRGDIQRGNKLILAAFGVGFSWAACNLVY